MKITLNLESDDMNLIPSSVTNWAITNWELGKLSLPLRFMFLFYNKKTTLTNYFEDYYTKQDVV